MATLITGDRTFVVTDQLEARDLTALRELYLTHLDFVRQTVMRLGGPRADGDDLVHEVFLVAMKKQGELAALREPRGWLYGVSVRVVSAARRRGRLRQTFGFEVPELADSATPHQAFEQKEASALVYRALDRIAEKKRTVFILYEIEGLKGEEIAALLGCPLKTVWSRLGHARLEFSKQLARLTGDPQ